VGGLRWLLIGFMTRWLGLLCAGEFVVAAFWVTLWLTDSSPRESS